MPIDSFYSHLEEVAAVYRKYKETGKCDRKKLKDAYETLRESQIGDMIIEQYHIEGIDGEHQQLAIGYLEHSIGVLFSDAKNFLASAQKSLPCDRDEFLQKAESSRIEAERNVCLARTLMPELGYFPSLDQSYDGLLAFSESIETDILITRRNPYSFRERIELKNALRRNDYEKASALKEKIGIIERKGSIPL